jgi:hypothetical protein
MLQDGFQYGEWEMHHKQKSLLREAEVSRRAKQAGTGAEEGPRFFRRAATWLGDWLVEWGSRMQAHGGETLPAGGSPGRTAL